MRRSALCAGVAAVGLFGSTHATAEQRAQGLAYLEWARPPGADECFSEAEIVEDVERSLKRRVFAPRAVADRVLHAEIGSAPSGWRGRIELATKRGLPLGAREIELEGSDCREASNALVLAISLMADLPVGPAERAASPAHVEPSLRLRAAAAPVLLVDDRPAVHPGANVSFEGAPRAFVPIVVDLFFQLQTPSVANGQSYRLFGTTLAVSLCPLHVGQSRALLLACIGPEATLYAAWGRGFPREATAFSSTFGALAEARGSYAFTRRLRGLLLLGAIATPQTAGVIGVVDGGEARVLGRTSRVMGLAGLGVMLEL